MASFNLTAEDSSPLISYAPAGSWIDTPPDDSLASSYSGGTYHTTSTNGATATMTFTGTGFSMLGGRRLNYGTYSVTVDEREIVSGTAESATNSTGQLLASSMNLPYGPHTVVVTNTGGNPIDIDSIEFVGQVGQPGAVQVSRAFDDGDSAIVYSPASAWATNSGSEFLNGTLHYTNATDAAATLTFSGEAVALYGTVSPNHADLSVTIDGKSQVMPGGSGGTITGVRSQTLLYYGSDLGPGQHTLVFAGISQTASAPFIDLDSINVFSVAESTSSLAPLPSATAAKPATGTAVGSLSTSTLRVISPGALIGSIVGGIIAVLAIIGIIFLLFFQRRRRRRQSNIMVEKSMAGNSPVLPLQSDIKKMEAGLSTPRASTFPPVRAFPAAPASALSSAFIRPVASPVSISPPEPVRHSIAPSYYGSDYMASSHSRDGSAYSSQSARPLILTVPRLEVPNPRSISRGLTPASSGMDSNRAPLRPARRPPTMDFVDVQRF